MTDFEHDESFAPNSQPSAGLGLDRYHTYYRQLLSSAIEDGVITAEERAQLDLAVEALGLDRDRMAGLEHALRTAYQDRHRADVVDAEQEAATEAEGPASGPASAATPSQADKTAALERRVAELEQQVRELQAELDSARDQAAIEIDLSDLADPVASSLPADPTTLHARLRHDARDPYSLDALYRACDESDTDRRWCIAQALVFVGAADEEQRALFEQHRSSALISPSSALEAASWSRLLAHSDDDPMTGEILANITPAVLLGHTSALQSEGKLVAPDPSQALEASTSTVQAARCFGWAGQILNTAPPLLYPNTENPYPVSLLLTLPPALHLGSEALSGRSTQELAFLAGRWLAYFRRERFMRKLVPGIAELEGLFLAALLIANPTMPLSAEARGRVKPVAEAIEPLLGATEADGLRAAISRFVEQGGRTNLLRWATGADHTAVRAGFALCGDLETASAMLRLEAPTLEVEQESQEPLEAGGSPYRQAAPRQHNVHDRLIDDLIVFLTGARYAELRRQIGVAIG